MVTIAALSGTGFSGELTSEAPLIAENQKLGGRYRVPSQKRLHFAVMERKPSEIKQFSRDDLASGMLLALKPGNPDSWVSGLTEAHHWPSPCCKAPQSIEEGDTTMHVL